MQSQQYSDIDNHQYHVMRELQYNTPLNSFGLPNGIYRLDLLPFHNYIPKGTIAGNTNTNTNANANTNVDVDANTNDANDDMLRTEESQQRMNLVEAYDEQRIAGFRRKDLLIAYTDLHYAEGFPAFQNGSPFWSKLLWEPMDAYTAFEHYLQFSIDTKETQGDTEIRSISALASRLSLRGYNPEQIAVAQEQFSRWSVLYYWTYRAKAYDLYRVVQHRKSLELRAIETTDNHYLIAKKLFQKLEVYLEDEERFWDLLTPKVAVDLLKTLTGLQRLSAGLPMGAPNAIGKGEHLGAGIGSMVTAGQSMEVILRQVAQSAGLGVGGGTVGGGIEGTTLDQNGNIISQAKGDSLLNRVMANPDLTAITQELIIKLGSKG